MGRTAQVKRDARIGEAHAKMEAQMKEAEAEQQRMESKARFYKNWKTSIIYARSNRCIEIRFFWHF